MSESDASPTDAEPPPRRRKAPPEPKRPALAAKADDLEALKKAVEDAAAVGAGLWFSYLFVLFYIAVATGAVTHGDLLLENPVKLPFLNIELPLKAFFVLAPILFLISHAYTLVHFALLSKKAKRFHDALHEQLRAADDAGTREALRGQLPSNIFVQFLAGPRDIRHGALGWLLLTIAWVTLVLGPVLLLLLLQIQFLPYHEAWISWDHRLALLADLVLIWWLWRAILAGRGEAAAATEPISGSRTADPSCPRLSRASTPGQDEAADVAARQDVEDRDKPGHDDRGKANPLAGWPRRLRGLAPGVLASAVLVIFSVTVATFPGESQGEWPDLVTLPARWVWVFGPSELSREKRGSRVSLHAAMFGGEVDEVTRQRKSRFSDSLVLPGFNLYEALKIDDPKKVEWRKHLFSLRGRDLKDAVFDFANLPKLDLTGAQLQGASLDMAQLQGASIDGARLQGASLEGTRLQGALLRGAQLQGASLDRARLQGASLYEARLQGASLHGVQLQGASLVGVTTKATDFSYAYVWRTRFAIPATSLTGKLNWGVETWEPWKLGSAPEPWTASRYADLRQQLEKAVPDGDRRSEALERIERLDCDDRTLAPCDPKAPAPPEAKDFAKAGADSALYRKALAEVLGDLVCKGGDSAVFALRGLLSNRRFAAAGDQAPALTARILGPDCPVIGMTEDDKARLRKAAQDAKEKADKDAAEAAKQEPAKNPAPAPPAKKPSAGKKACGPTPLPETRSSP